MELSDRLVEPKRRAPSLPFWAPSPRRLPFLHQPNVTPKGGRGGALALSRMRGHRSGWIGALDGASEEAD
jgi:hypothetical protein